MNKAPQEGMQQPRIAQSALASSISHPSAHMTVARPRPVPLPRDLRLPQL